LIDIIKPTIVSQTPYMSDSDYLEKFRTQLDVLNSAGGELCVHHGMVQDELIRNGVGSAAQASTGELQIAGAAARSRFEGALFLLKSNHNKYGRLVQELANDFNKGHDSYPDTLTAAYELMLHDVRDQDSRVPSHGIPGMAFSTVGDRGQAQGSTGTPASSTQPNPRPDVTCHKCGKVGHFSNKCAEVSHANGTVLCAMIQEDLGAGWAAGGTALAQFGSAYYDDEGYGPEHGFTFLLSSGATVVEKCFDGKLFEQHKAYTGHGVPPDWVLIDSQSTVHVFCNRSLLRNIRKAPRSCMISCIAGVVEVKMIGDLPGFPTPVWFHPDGIANILSLHLVAEHCRVQYDSNEAGRAFHVTDPDGSVRDFKPSASGLHYWDASEGEKVLVSDGTAIQDTLEDEDDLHDDDYVPGNDDSDSAGHGSYDHEPHPVGGVEDYDHGHNHGSNNQELIPDGDDNDSSDEEFVHADESEELIPDGDDNDSSDEEFVHADESDSFVHSDESDSESKDNAGFVSDDTQDKDSADETGSVANDTGDAEDTPEDSGDEENKDDDGTEDGGVDNDGTEDGGVGDTPEGVSHRDTPEGVSHRSNADTEDGGDDENDGTEDGGVDDTPEGVSHRDTPEGVSLNDGTEDGGVDDTPEGVSHRDTPEGVSLRVNADTEDGGVDENTDNDIDNGGTEDGDVGNGGAEDGGMDGTPAGVAPGVAASNGEDFVHSGEDDNEDGGVDGTPEGVGPGVADSSVEDSVLGDDRIRETNDGDGGAGNAGIRIVHGDSADETGSVAYDLGPDVFSRPLPNAEFVKFRRLILNLGDDGGPEKQAPIAHRSVLEKVVTSVPVQTDVQTGAKVAKEKTTSGS
jgi:hypothetical protein